MADIKNNEVVSVGNNVQAVVVNQKKFIFCSVRSELSAADYSVR